jgi:uncharacterized protein (TIRG00374 family)
MVAVKNNRAFTFVLKLTLGLGLLIVILGQIGISNVFEQIRSATAGYLLMAVVFQVVAKIVWTSRWQTVLKLNNIQRSFWELLGLVHIGLFFNNFLPSAVGGDVIRGYYASNSKTALAKSYGALIIERTMGLLSLALMVVVAVLYVILDDAIQTSDILLVLAGIGSVFLFVFGVSLIFWDGWHRLLTQIAKAFPSGAKSLEDLSGSLKMFRRVGWSARIRIMVTSVVLQIVAVLFYLACARSLGIATPVVVFFVIIPVAIVVAMLPISLNGLGIRETALVVLLVGQGLDEAQVGAFALLALAVSTVFALIGGIIYIFWHPVHTSNL